MKTCRPHFLFLGIGILLIHVLGVVESPYAKEFTITPRILLSEEYTDNVLLTSNKIDEYITRAVPGIILLYEAPRFKLNFDGAVDYRYYSNNSYYESAQPNGTGKDETSYNINALANAEVIKNHFNVEVQDVYERVSLDLTRDYTQESLFVNQSDRNTFTVNPYFTLNLSPASKLILGYKYLNIWYKEDSGTNKSDNIGYGEVHYEASSKTVILTGYEYTNEASDDGDFGKHVAYAGARYEYAEKSLVDLRIGNIWIDYESGPSHTTLFWDGKITHTFAHVVTSFRTSRDYVENPSGDPQEVQSYTLSIQGAFDRLKPGINLFYAKYWNSMTDDLDSRSYSGSSSVSYDLSQKSTIVGDYTIERVDDQQANTHTTTYYTGLRFDFSPSTDLTLSLIYRYQYSHSPQVASDNYHSNRVIIELAKRF